jgi:predicted nucleic acid-binding protein
VSEPIVTNSTCLIALERIGQLALLPGLFDPILAPPKVHEEFGVSLPWLRRQAPASRTTVAALMLMMAEGEAEAIALAAEQKCRVILDDRKARLIAKQMGLKVIGTVGVLVKAKRSEIIPQIKPLLDALQACGFRLSAPLMAEALRLARE